MINKMNVILVFIIILFASVDALPVARKSTYKMYPNICDHHLRYHPKTSKLFCEYNEYLDLFPYHKYGRGDSECRECPRCLAINDFESQWRAGCIGTNYYWCVDCGAASRISQWRNCEEETLNSGYFQECNRKYTYYQPFPLERG